LGIRRLGLGHAVALPLLAALLTISAALPAGSRAQGGFAQPGGTRGAGFTGTIFAGPNLFPEDGRIKLLVLGLHPTGLTESAAEQIGLILQKNLSNTGHFAVVGPREMNAAFEKEQAGLVECREIACGVESGKILAADRVIVGTIRMEDPRFILRVRIIDPANNLTDYEEEVRFSDDSMDDDLFKLANSISRNSLRIGRVLSTSVRGLVISIGKRQGVKIGDQMVIYKQDVPIADLQGQQVDVQRKNIAIVKVLNVNEGTTEAILVHHTEEPQVGHFAVTYLDPARQIELVENTRRELDTGIRLANRVRPLELAPVMLADSDRKRWQRRVTEAETDKSFWKLGMITGGVGVAAAMFVPAVRDNSNHNLVIIGFGAVAVYSFFQWTTVRNAMNDLQVEGRAKGFVDNLQFGPAILDNAPALAFNFKF
jgi:hypothetical protein